MDFRKLISIWALLALMLGQVALAQHSATHIDHGISLEFVSSHSDDYTHDHNDREEGNKHQCPECVLTKALQTAFYNASTTLFPASQTGATVQTYQSFKVAINRYKTNAPRAPPVVLI